MNNSSEYNIFAIIVCYHPNSNVYSLLKQLKRQQVYPIIIDNSETSSFEEIDEILSYKFLLLNKNYGIAYAQNLGIDEARKLGASTILFLDQDSQLTDDLIYNLYSPIKNGITNISVPIYKNAQYGFFYKMVNISKNGIRRVIIPSPSMANFQINNAISSGTMIRLSTLDKIGGMDEALFIDYVDTEWFLRANRIGEQALVVTNAIMDHTIGDNIIDLRLFKVPVHSPLRRYYRVRNAIKLFSYPHIPKLLAIRECFFAVIHQLVIISFCDKKRDYIHYFFKAVKDGVLGKKGKMD